MINWRAAKQPIKRRNGWLILLYSLLSIGFYTIYWLYRCHQELPSRESVDLPGKLWAFTFALITLVLFSFLIASGYGESWAIWSDATTPQKMMFYSGLGTAVLFNLWFAIGTERLTTRVSLLLSQKPAPLVVRSKKTLLIFGVFCEMLAMILPTMAEAQLISLSESALKTLQVIASLGTGSLFAWCITLHQDMQKLGKTVPEGELLSKPNHAF